MTGVRWLVLATVVALIPLSGAQADDRYNLYSYGSEVQTPGHPIVFTFGTDAPAGHGVSVKVYRLTTNAYVDIMRGHTTLQESIVRGLPEVAHASGGLGTKDDSWNRKVVLTSLPIGTYVVLGRLDAATSVSSLDVTTLGIAQARSYYGRGDMVYFPVDLRTYDRYPGGVEPWIASDAGTHALSMSDGIARDNAQLRGNDAVVARAPDGSVAASRVDTESVAATEAGFVQFDRPVYRPGDTIGVRAILRSGSIGSYTVPMGTRHVRVQAPDGSDVFNRDEPLTSFGTLSASVRLPEDAQTGSYSVTIGKDLTKSILVAAYKKPEYELSFNNAPEHVVGGTSVPFSVTAKYFFGRPAAGMHLHYTVYEQPHYYEWWFGPYESFVKTIDVWGAPGRKELATGDVTSDANGRGAFNVSTKETKQDDDISIAVDGRDASGRTVTTSANLLVTAAAFQVSINPDTWFGQAGVASKLHVNTRTYDNDGKKPNVPVHVEITGRRWENDREVTTSTKTFDVSTDDKGDATIEWTPQEGGDYVIKATAKDEGGRVATGSTYLWVLGGGEESWLAPIETPMLVAAKTTVLPGARAKFIVALPKRNRDVLIMTSTDRLLSAQVVRVKGTSAEVTVDAPVDATTLNVIAMLPGENGIEQAYSSVKIAPPARLLHVSIASSKHRYEPGERATFDVRVTDVNGKPQRTELGIGVVDESIYAVQAEDTADPIDALYSGYAYVYGTASWFRPNRGEALGAAGGISDEATVAERAAIPAPVAKAMNPAAQPPGPQIRSTFLDTAYWSPSVVTGDDGRASLAFTWPDNLTTWRATGVGVTENGDIGKGSGSALVTKDFLVRLETPRFLRAGDRSNIIGIAQGVKADPHVRLTLDVGALSKDPLDASLELDRFQSASASWPVTAPGVGSVLLTLSGTDGVRSDAVRLPLPLEAGTAAEHVRDAGSSASRSSFRVTVPPGYLAGAVHLTLSPSLVAELIANQRLLDVYPYFCTEQTMSAAIPAVFIGRVLRETHLKSPSDVDVKEIVRHAVARLKQLQHGDGSWGWWENDDGHPFMTAYALFGLAEFRKDGYSVPDEMYDNGVNNLVEQLKSASGDTLAFWGGGQEGSEWNTRAFMLYALADAAPKRVDRTLLEKTRAHVRQLNPYAIAVLGLAERWLGNDDAARSLLAELDRRATHDGAFIFWRGSTWHYAWEDDPIETTAYALRFEVAMGAGSETTDKIVNFLRAQRQGDWWYTTKDTAAAIYALTETIKPDANEFSPDETIHVVVDGHTVRTLHVTTPILDAADASVIVPLSLVPSGGTVTFERSGRGALYWSSDAVRYVPTNATQASDASKGLLERLFAKAPPLKIWRRYTLKHAGPWRVGDEVTVDVTVRANSDVQYVAIEDPFPAGAEHQPEQGRAGDEAWSGIQLLDDRAVFFADRLYPDQNLTIEYTIRVTTPGRYTAAAPSAYAMYGPPVSALGSQEAINVAP
jgi:uncharacterized protein YfaS (alpha-2-macroglobulin family)